LLALSRDDFELTFDDNLVATTLSFLVFAVLAGAAGLY